MRRSLLSLTLIAGLCVSSRAEPVTDKWNVRVLRMEGAAVSVREAAEHLQTISMDVATSGRAQQAARVRSAADTLHRKVVSAGLAANILDEGISTAEQP